MLLNCNDCRSTTRTSGRKLNSTCGKQSIIVRICCKAIETIKKDGLLNAKKHAPSLSLSLTCPLWSPSATWGNPEKCYRILNVYFFTTASPKSLNPIYIVTYSIKWVMPYWTENTFTYFSEEPASPPPSSPIYTCLVIGPSMGWILYRGTICNINYCRARCLAIWWSAVSLVPSSPLSCPSTPCPQASEQKSYGLPNFLFYSNKGSP